ncbi:MAG: hypothetical protein ABJQ21_10030 [Roseibium sp.]
MLTAEPLRDNSNTILDLHQVWIWYYMQLLNPAVCSQNQQTMHSRGARVSYSTLSECNSLSRVVKLPDAEQLLVDFNFKWSRQAETDRMAKHEVLVIIANDDK